MKKYVDILKKFVARRKLLSAIILLTIVLIIGFTFYSNSKKPTITQATVSRVNLTEELTLSGEIDAEEKADLAFSTGGLVSWVGIKKGDSVSQYQAVASLDTRSAKKTLDAKLLEYSLERGDFDQIREDNQNRTPAQALSNTMKRLLEENQWNLEKTINSVELQDLVIKLSTIYSPIQGIVTNAATLYPGINVAPFVTQYTIVNPATIYFRVSADQTEVVTLNTGSIGKIMLDSYPDEEIPGKIENVSFTPRTDETGTVYDVKITINADNSAIKYLLGMTGDITFVTNEKKNVLSLPATFIKTDDKGNYVFTDRAKKQKKYIETGIEGEEATEVSNIAEGTVVYD